MCGITGTVNWGDISLVEKMTDIQSHRGPDDRGVCEIFSPHNGYIRLGSRRLAIQDLSPAGHMPMSTQDGRLTIIFNGEIYNYPRLRKELENKGYTFVSNSDTEAILYLYQEYGYDAVSRLNGMFALAIWDDNRQHLFLARDHFGIKPLYYVHDGKRLAFASEVKALLQIPSIKRQVNIYALHQYLTFLWVPDPLTAFEGIYKLPAGHFAIYRNEKLETHQYWDLKFPSTEHDFKLSESELASELRTRFVASVKAQLLSDVPLGCFLSAGLDSSSIVAAMAQVSSEPISTYTVTFPKSFRRGELTLDDPDVVNRIAGYFGCKHTEIIVEPDVADLLPLLVWHMDEPVADPAMIMAYIVNREARKSVTVLLSGVGGDELFAGYRKHLAHGLAQYYRHLPSSIRRKIIEPLVSAVPSMHGTRFFGYVRLLKKMAQSGSLAARERFLMDSTYLTQFEKSKLYSQGMLERLSGVDPYQKHLEYFSNVSSADFINQMLYLDTRAFMTSLNLTYNDKMSMASSTEVRVPFLDWEFAQWVASNVPPDLKLHNGTTKYIFREAMRPLLPAEVLRQRKAGFGAPTAYWLSHNLRDMAGDLLSPDRVRNRGYFQPESVQRLMMDQWTGRRDWSYQIWSLLTLELWHQTFID